MTRARTSTVLTPLLKKLVRVVPEPLMRALKDDQEKAQLRQGLEQLEEVIDKHRPAVETTTCIRAIPLCTSRKRNRRTEEIP